MVKSALINALKTDGWMTDAAGYEGKIEKRIALMRERYPLQPILFVGSGLSRRWINAPTWYELIDWAIQNCPEIDKPIQYFLQQEGSLPKVASRISSFYQSWAWGSGMNAFPKLLFENGVPADTYLKYAVAKYIKNFGVTVAHEFSEEVELFSAIRPHAVITTNYDELIEAVLEDYQPILGSGLITAPFASIGEVFKIHGTIGKPSSLVLTEGDYDIFSTKRKYLTAKLLTFFAEHPLIFIGYSVEDENIRRILEDLDEAVDLPGGLLKNIFFLTRTQSDTPPDEKILQVAPGKGVRVNAIETDDFGWVFKAFGHKAPLANVNPQVLRSILARSYNLVRSDIPRQKVEVDFDLISGKVNTSEEFAKIFGLATLQPATEFSATYPFNLTEVGKQLGFPGWHGAANLLKEIERETGIKIKETDNRYHCTVRMSTKSKAQMYSEAAVNLLKRVRDGQSYDIDL